MKSAIVCVLAAGFVVVATPATASTVTIEMKNTSAGGMMAFEPAYFQIKPGDSVLFKATDKGHNAASIPGLAPDGATPFNGKMGEDLTVTFSKPGFYGVKCTPHFVLGMVALIKVGNKPTNADAAKGTVAKLPGLAKTRLSTLLAQAK